MKAMRPIYLSNYYPCEPCFLGFGFARRFILHLLMWLYAWDFNEPCSAFLWCRLTGFQMPAPVTSTTSVLALRLTSDFAVSAHGFKLFYQGKPSKTSIAYVPFNYIVKSLCFSGAWYSCIIAKMKTNVFCQQHKYTICVYCASWLAC